jgi:hypothetical protein
MEIFQRDEIAKAISTPATMAATRGNSARGCTVVDDLRRSVISQQMPELVQDDVLSVQWTRRVLEEHIVRTRHYKPETARAESGLVFTREDGRTLRHEYIDTSITRTTLDPRSCADRFSIPSGTTCEA